VELVTAPPTRYVTLVLSVTWMHNPWPTLYTCRAGNSTTTALGPLRNAGSQRSLDVFPFNAATKVDNLFMVLQQLIVSNTLLSPSHYM
jgi:hypothetical protein